VPGPLEGIRVVDLTTVFAGPYCTLLLADMGAEVVKVEGPEGEIARRVGPARTPAMSPVFMSVNRNKRDVCLDLKSPGGREALARMIDSADVLVHNMRTDAIRRVGADAESTRARNPALVHVSITGFGSTGPYAHLPAYDDVIQAASGMVALQSDDPERLEYVRTVVADKTIGLLSFGATCAALVQRQRTGEGCAIEVPMFESFASYVLLEHLYGKTFEPPTASAGYERVLAPDRRPFKTADGWISVVFYNDRHWNAFFGAIGQPELATDARFADHRSRTSNSDVLYAMVADTMPERTTQEWIDLLRELDVPAMPVASLDDVINDPHLSAVELLQRAVHPTEGNYIRIRNPISFSTPLDDDRIQPPGLGEHTRAVLLEVGYSDEEIDSMITSDVAFEAS
jgi:crotonobetainyl-CoA:carnitine CoA-transferase CaiB-like acyl-CoA transferase